MLSAEYPSAADVPPNLRAFRKKVELSVDILKHLQENTDSALTDGNTSPVSRKKGKTVTSNRRIDPLPFNFMRIAVPNTDGEVRNVCDRVLSQLRNILEVCELITDSLRVELNSPRVIFLLSGSQCYHRFSNPRTWRQADRQKSQINLETQPLP